MSWTHLEEIKVAIATDAARISTVEQLEEFRVRYLGRKGSLAHITSLIPSLPAQERADFGQEVNALKARIQSIVEEKKNQLAASSSEATKQRVDFGSPGIAFGLGRQHPLTLIIEEICEIFRRLGFSVFEGPEIETEFNNFTGLNIPLEHPSRDAFDTFYLKGAADNPRKLLLRSHTSPGQIRVMKSRKPPLAVIVPGRVYRPDAVDASHSFMFHQIEGFMVGSGIRFSDLKGTLSAFARAVFGEGIRMRFRPHFFPFTEPSAEVDISCIICKGKGCSACGRKGWLEILGAGMIHPNVFKHVGYDPRVYTGFAFGMGIERIAMLKYNIHDIRLFFENDLRFLHQF